MECVCGDCRLVGEATRLVAPEEMGTVYKAMAITPRGTIDTERPAFVPAAFEPVVN